MIRYHRLAGFAPAIALLVLLFGTNTTILAQSAARVDESVESDAQHVQAGAKYFMDRATSGEIKDWSEVDRIETESFAAMTNSIAYKALSGSWVQIAGSISGHASGRARSIAFDPSNPDIAYLATASGGLWKTTNATATSPTWVSLSDGNIPILWMGAVAVDPNNGQTIYAGTGEVIGGWSPAVPNSNLTPAGTGIYKSVDGGMNWTQVATAAVAGPMCGAIAVDPSNSQHVYAATGNGTGGLLVTNNGGTSWTKASAGADPVSIAIDPKNNKNVYVGLQSGGVYRSNDGGVTWTKCTITGGTGSLATTIVAVAPSLPSTIYASISSGSGQQGSATYGIAMSADYGVTWTVVNKCNQSGSNGSPLYVSGPQDASKYPQPNFLWIQGHYGNAIAVNPLNPAQITVGGIDIWTSSDGGVTLKTIGFSKGGLSANYYTHADVHALVYQGGTLWACDDGGIANTANGGGTWNTAVNQGLATLQFVGVDADPGFTYMLGGTQDNGVERASSPSATQFDLTRGGDCGYVWIDPSDPTIAYSTTPSSPSEFNKSSNSGVGSNGEWDISQFGNPNFINPKSPINNEGMPFYPPYDATSDGNFIALGGNSHIFVDQNGGNDGFMNESNPSVGISPYVIYCYPNDETVAWAGSTNGKVYRCTNFLDQVTQWTPSSALGGGVVTGIAADPGNEGHVYAVVAGVGGNNKHFYVSNDTGRTWASPATNFPNVSCNSMTVSPADNSIYVGTDKGVVFSTDVGVTWSALSQGMPMVQVNSLKIRGANSQYLLAGTYGRGMFYLQSPSSVAASAATLSSLASLDQSFPNPVSQSVGTHSTIGFTVKNAGVARLSLHDLLGREVRVIANASFGAGHHSVTLNTNDLATGTYICALSTSGVTVTEKISVVK